MDSEQNNNNPQLPQAEQASRTLFVFSGGGTPGLYIHAGIMAALHEAGIRADECRGCSAGAFAAAWDASGRDPYSFAAWLVGLKDRDIRDEVFLWKVRAIWKGAGSILKGEKAKALIARMYPPDFDDLEKPCTIMTARVDNAEDWPISSGDLRSAILASMSVPGVFPPVYLDSTAFIDGGVRKNLPVPSDLRGYSRIVLSVASGSYRPRNKGLLQSMVTGLNILTRGQTYNTLELFGLHESQCKTGYSRFMWGGKEVILLWPQIEATRGLFRTDPVLYGQVRRWATGKVGRDAGT